MFEYRALSGDVMRARGGVWWVECVACGSGTKYHQAKRDAAETWNARAGQDHAAMVGHLALLISQARTTATLEGAMRTVDVLNGDMK